MFSIIKGHCIRPISCDSYDLIHFSYHCGLLLNTRLICTKRVLTDCVDNACTCEFGVV